MWFAPPPFKRVTEREIRDEIHHDVLLPFMIAIAPEVYKQAHNGTIINTNAQAIAEKSYTLAAALTSQYLKEKNKK